MGEKIIGKVKWFSNRAGYGFITPSSENSPTTEDVFVHQSNIVVDDGTYRTLDEGSEVEFEIVTEESGKLRSMNVTAVGGGPVVPSGGKRRRRRKTGKGDGEEEEEGEAEKADQAEESHQAEESREMKEGEAKQGNNKRRNRGRGRNKNKEHKDEKDEVEEAKEGTQEGSKEEVGGDSKAKKNKKMRGRSKKRVEGAEGDNDKENGDNDKGEGKKKQKVKRFDDGFSENVKEMVKKKVDIRQPFCLVSVGDSRVKLGQEGYAALAHSSGIVGEGTFVCDGDGLVKFTWQNVLVAEEDTWKVSDPVSSAANGAIIASFKWEDDNVASVKRDETTETFWGSDKADLRDLFETNSFQMRKVFLDRGPPRRNRRRNRDKKKPDGAKNDKEVENGDEKETEGDDEKETEGDDEKETEGDDEKETEGDDEKETEGDDTNEAEETNVEAGADEDVTAT